MAGTSSVSPLIGISRELAAAEVSGEILDAPSVRRELALQPESDTAQVLLAAWQQRSADCLRRLSGDFAFVLRTDGAAALLGRDPCSLRSLYWCRGAGGGVASDFVLQRLLNRSGAPPRIWRQSLHEYLRLGDISAPHTFVEGVHAVEAGEILRVSAAGVQALAWPRDEEGTRPAASFEAAVDMLDERLTRSIHRHLSGSDRPAAFLSAGIDSALICALAARLAPNAVALTVGFDDPGLDEAPVAARIAAHLGLRHEVLRFSRSEYLAAFDRLAQGMDQPMADPASMATLLAFEQCRERFDVMLEGTGADEAVGAMPPRHVRLAVGVGSRVPAVLRRRLVRTMARVPALAGYTPILDFEHPAEPLMRWRGFTQAEIEELCGEPVSLADTTFYRTFARFARGDHYARYSALYGVMPGDRLTQAMRLTGACVRFPYCARDVDAFLRQLPADWRWQPGQPKRILGELLARHVPRAIWAGPKRGFTFPLHDFLAGDDWMLVRRHVLDGGWLHRGVLRPDVVRRYAQQYIGGERRLLFRVWALVVLGAWLEQHPELG